MYRASHVCALHLAELGLILSNTWSLDRRDWMKLWITKHHKAWLWGPEYHWGGPGNVQDHGYHGELHHQTPA